MRKESIHLRKLCQIRIPIDEIGDGKRKTNIIMVCYLFELIDRTKQY